MRPKTISATSLIDLSLAGPHERVKRVAEARELYLRSEDIGFDPDYYRAVKEGLELQLRNAEPPEWLAAYLARQPLDATKARHSRACASGLAEWMRRTKPAWSGKAKVGNYRHAGLVVRVNPELIVSTRGGGSILLKLYLKEPEATKAKLAGPLYLLDSVTSDWRPQDMKVGILDARRGTVFTAARLPATASITLRSEVESLASIWAQLDARAA